MLLAEPAVISALSIGIRVELKKLKKEYCIYKIKGVA
jgi:hypothetical protein